ncbi:hypothetical protein EA658_09845 [Pseudoxanthomonas winnipegensis]|uniref:Uncharacterized protein n=1 Tax=Pseudoxanthomonas winnipegensis TaxID=2480810 RepID=A0ABY1WCR2_9GAMM|nr:hypothetical protein [Pseudoxanthomonas winnipegensis]TAA12463.1 hypothetical protein EA659_03805 [Pseudoxanthomonas winnipegensis]TAA19172.1 hypothetical protein EA658_09845 [Pseudoxanthomonas winnipegensis]TAH70433.1 hypothetical protein EA657_16910 [Pseudoxanthomonas winnipegensis]
MKLRTWITWAVAVLFCSAGLALATRAPDVAGTCLCVALALFVVAMGMDSARDARAARQLHHTITLNPEGFVDGSRASSEVTYWGGYQPKRTSAAEPRPPGEE